jgi:SAM-dependent methyltransferase
MPHGLGQRLRAYAEKDGRGYPDWAMRYVPVVRRMMAHSTQARPILEIGANENGFSRFAKLRVFAVDIEMSHLLAARATQDVVPVLASAAALPFADGSIRTCVAIETLEHLPEASREEAIAEIARVLERDGAAAITFHTGRASVDAEAYIQRRYKALTGNTVKWLDEHASEGLPDPTTITRLLNDHLGATHRVTHSKNAPLWIWRWMWLVMMCDWPGRGNAVFQALLRLFTPLLCRIKLGTCYRTILWVEAKNDD